MKTNKALRLAAILLILTLASFSGIGSAYAKYISSDSARDTARVAKFGVVASVYGDLFGPAYSGPAANKIVSYSDTSATVKAVQQADLIAPGTKGGTLTISLKGTPETGTSITLDHVKGSDNNKPYAVVSPFLMGNRTYCIPTAYDGTINEENYSNFCDNKGISLTAKPTGTAYYPRDTVTVDAANYYPLIWKVSVNGAAATEYTGTDAVQNAWNAVQTAINSATGTPNTPMNLNVTVTWEWPFADDNEYRSKCDTIMGDYAPSFINNDSTTNIGMWVRVGADQKGNIVPSRQTFGTKDGTAYTSDQKINLGYSGALTGGTLTSGMSTIKRGGKNVSVVDIVLSAAFDISLTIAQTD